MKVKGYVHNDIKTDNYTILLNELGKKELRFIDLGEFNNKLQSGGFTQKYYLNPNRKIEKLKGDFFPIFENMD